jgi:hypothetical protein
VVVEAAAEVAAAEVAAAEVEATDRAEAAVFHERAAGRGEGAPEPTASPQLPPRRLARQVDE